MFAEVTSDKANNIGEQKEALLQRLSQRITQDAQHGLGTVTAYSPISTRDAQKTKSNQVRSMLWLQELTPQYIPRISPAHVVHNEAQRPKGGKATT